MSCGKIIFNDLILDHFFRTRRLYIKLNAETNKNQFKKKKDSKMKKLKTRHKKKQKIGWDMIEIGND